MSQDLYEVLEIPENANDIWIRRAYDLKRKAIDIDASLSADKKQLMLIAVEKAFNTLSSPSARERYDNRHAPQAKAKISSDVGIAQVPSWAWVAAAVVLLFGVGMYWQHSRATEKMRIERERFAVVQAEKMRELELKESGQTEAVRLIGTVIDQQDAERHASREERERRYQRQRDDAMANAEHRSTQSAAASALFAQQAEAQRQRADEDSQRRQAQAEVDRQKRWLEQQARAEQQIMDRQAATARADAARSEAEERRIRTAEEYRSRYRR